MLYKLNNFINDISYLENIDPKKIFKINNKYY